MKKYYEDQTNWTIEDYAELNAELNKLFCVVIDMNFAKRKSVRNYDAFDKECSSIDCGHLSEKTKAIMVAILNQQKIKEKIIELYPNLYPLSKTQKLKEPLYLSDTPYNIFNAYKDMNIYY
ncbi:MAG: hypothetical protein J6066_02420 [Lachnospiraceae bacterium]|nr:hypothetical protein [Lachnospiraceae bacterium]